MESGTEKSKLLFLGIDLIPEIKDEIEDYKEKLKDHTKSAKWKNRDSFHITVKYIGKVSKEKIADIDKAISKIDMPSFQIKIGRLSGFDKKKRIRVLYLGVLGDLKILDQLYDRVEHRMYSIGFERELRPYKPHITIARDAVFNTSLYELNKEFRNFEFSDMEVGSITLFESRRGDKGREYIPIREFGLYKK